MFLVDQLLLIGALLLLVGIASSKLSSRAGLPVLVLFVVVGMLAGSDGIGGIAFENYSLAHALGTIGLAIILFDGGLRTSFKAVRPALGPSLTLASVGVLITAGLTGLAVRWILGLPLLESLLLGSIVASTDAAAVMSVLRSSGLNLPDRIAHTLEVESGANDPMAIFLTVGLIEMIRGGIQGPADLLQFFAAQMLVGALVGWLVGRAAVEVVNRIELQAAGLYPVLVAAFGLLAYGMAASAGGSGFLSIYVAGVVLGSHTIVFQRGILLFHDGAAWLAQIGMFVLLGLLAFPSQLLETAGAGLQLAAVLIFVARPAATLISVLPWRFSIKEALFISLAGLKGAVPIVLATYPLLLGLEGGEQIFDVVFFVVLVSALLQGVSLPPVAGWLGLNQPAIPRAPVTLEITSLKHLNGDIVEYTVLPDSRVAGLTVRDLALPASALIAMVVRDEQVVAPRGSTRIEANDHLFIVLAPEARPLVDMALLGGRGAAFVSGDVEFPLTPATTVGQLASTYGIEMEGEEPSETLGHLLERRLGDRLTLGRGIVFGPVKLRATEIVDAEVTGVGLQFRALPEALTEADRSHPISSSR